MGNILLIFGSNSHILNGFYPDKKYTEIIIANRSSKTNKNFKTRFIYYDLLCKNEKEDKKIINILNSNKFDNLDVLFASYTKKGLQHTDTAKDICDGLFANVARPLSLFSLLSENFINKKINVIFISSIYSIVSPNKNNYQKESEVNPLFYGASKAAVNQGIKWLSTRNINHKFNSIILGAMPKDNVIQEQPLFVENLINSTPSNKFITHEDLNKTINFIFNTNSNNIRGTSIVLDGGYTIW